MKKVLFIILAVVLLTVTVFALEVYEIPQNVDIPEDAYGVFQVPCIGTNSPLYEAPRGNGQDVIDEENSALIRKYGRGWLIADHSCSEVGNGIWCVENMEVGGGAFLIREGKPEICYGCTAIYLCRQNGDKFTYHGQNVNPTKDGIICISCADEDGYVYLAVYEYIGEMP